MLYTANLLTKKAPKIQLNTIRSQNVNKARNKIQDKKQNKIQSKTHGNAWHNSLPSCDSFSSSLSSFSIPFKSNQKTVDVPQNDNDNKKKKIILGASILALVGSAIAFCLKKNTTTKEETKALNEINILKEAIENAINQDEKLKIKVSTLDNNRFSLERFPELFNNESSSFQDLRNFQTILAMDSENMAPENLKLPEFVTFKRIDNDAFSKLKKVLFDAFKIQNYELEYGGNLQDVTEKLSAIAEKNPRYRVFVDIKDLPNKHFAYDIEKDEKELEILKNFFKGIRGKKITFITSDAPLINLLNSFEDKPKTMEFNYSIKNVKGFMKAAL